MFDGLNVLLVDVWKQIWLSNLVTSEVKKHLFVQKMDHYLWYKEERSTECLMKRAHFSKSASSSKTSLQETAKNSKGCFPWHSHCRLIGSHLGIVQKNFWMIWTLLQSWESYWCVESHSTSWNFFLIQPSETWVLLFQVVEKTAMTLYHETSWNSVFS